MIFRPSIYLMALLVSACATAQVSDPAAANTAEQPTDAAATAKASNRFSGGRGTGSRSWFGGGAFWRQ
jgi:hypothetical protein